MAELPYSNRCDSSDGTAAYGYILAAARKCMRVRRRIFGGAIPEWFSDASGIVGNVSVFNCFPTIAAILFVPHHFFRKLNESGRRAIPLSVSPVKLVMNCAALATMCLVLVGLPPYKFAVVGIAFAIAFLSPLWVSGIVCVTTLMAAYCRWLPKSEIGIIRHIGRTGLIHFVFLRVLGAVLPYETSARCLEMLFLFRLNIKKAIWGWTYLSMILFLYEGIILAATVAIILIAQVFSSPGGGAPDLIAQFWSMGIIIFLAASVRPYVACFGAMLSGVAVHPNHRYYKYRAWQLRILSDKFFDVDIDEDKRNNCRREISELLWISVADNVRAERRMLTDDEQTLLYLTGRAAALATVDDLDIFFDTTDELRLCKCFITMREMRLITTGDLVPPELFSNKQLWIDQVE